MLTSTRVLGVSELLPHLSDVCKRVAEHWSFEISLVIRDQFSHMRLVRVTASVWSLARMRCNEELVYEALSYYCMRP